MHRFSLSCCGIGDGMACHDRNHSSYLYSFGDTRLLVDCGEPISRHLRAAGVAPDAIERVLLTHLHCDHFGGFFMLLQGWWLDQRSRVLPVHLPADGIAPLRGMLNAAMLFDELLPFALRFEVIKGKQAFAADEGRVRITPFPTTHLEGLRQRFQAMHPLAFAAFSFLFETDGLRIGHSGDIGDVNDLAPLLAKPLDLLVVELAHVEPADLFTCLRGHAIGRIVFTHVGREAWAHLADTQRLAAQMLPDASLMFARDGDVVTL